MVKITKDKLIPSDTEHIAHTFMDNEQKKIFEEEKELNLAHSIHGLGRFRLNIYNQRGTIGVVIRRIKLEILSLDDLDLNQDQKIEMKLQNMKDAAGTRKE